MCHGEIVSMSIWRRSKNSVSFASNRGKQKNVTDRCVILRSVGDGELDVGCIMLQSILHKPRN